MATYNFSASGTSLLVTLNTQSGTYPVEISSYKSASASLNNDAITIKEFGIHKNILKFHQIGTIATVTPTDINDAYTKILALI